MITPSITIAALLQAIQESRPQPVYLFCAPDDHHRLTAACQLLPSVSVIAHELVPAGAVWITKNLPHPHYNQGD